MTIDVQIKKSDVIIVLFFFGEGYRGRLVIEEMKKRVNVVFTSKEQECVIHIPFVK